MPLLKEKAILNLLIPLLQQPTIGDDDVAFGVFDLHVLSTAGTPPQTARQTVGRLTAADK